MGIFYVKPEWTHHTYDGIPKALPVHPDPYAEYLRGYRGKYAPVTRAHKFVWAYVGGMITLYMWHYMYDNYTLFWRLKRNVEDYRAQRTMYLDLPDGYLEKLESAAGTR